MSRKNIKWLFSELPGMVQKGFISEEQSSRIENHYSSELKSKPNVALIAFSIFGSVLLAAGIILILAHNWSDLPRFVKVIFSYAPLIISQGIAGWVILKRQGSIPWSEGISAFAFLAMGSTIALISQTYHIKGDLGSFLLTWMLLSVLLVYLFRSITSSVFYIAGITVWALAESPNALLYWPLLFIILPMYILEYKIDPFRKGTAIIGWFIAISLVFAGFSAVGEITQGYRILFLICLFISLYSLGIILFPDDESIWRVPFHRIGILGLSITYIYLSYKYAWENLSFEKVANTGYKMMTPGFFDYLISIALLIIAIILIVFAIRKSFLYSSIFAIGLPLLILGFAFSPTKFWDGFFTFLFNFYVLGLGINYMWQGIRRFHGKTMNYGFALVAALIVLRFFDTDLSFLLRGLIFVALGAGFLSANVFLAKKKAV